MVSLASANEHIAPRRNIAETEEEKRLRALEVIKAVIVHKHANKDSIRDAPLISDYEYLILDEVGWQCEGQPNSPKKSRKRK